MRELGPERARGIAVIDDKTSAAALDDMQKAGIRGVRVNLETAGEFDPAASAKKLLAAGDRVKDRGWHVQGYSRLSIIAALSDQLGAQPVPLVVHRVGVARAQIGPEPRDFSALIPLA